MRGFRDLSQQPLEPAGRHCWGQQLTSAAQWTAELRLPSLASSYPTAVLHTFHLAKFDILWGWPLVLTWWDQETVQPHRLTDLGTGFYPSTSWVPLGLMGVWIKQFHSLLTKYPNTWPSESHFCSYHHIHFPQLFKRHLRIRGVYLCCGLSFSVTTYIMVISD